MTHKFWNEVMQVVRYLLRTQPSDRPWTMPVASAVATCGPLWLAAWAGHLDQGLVASMGGLLFLYLPDGGMKRQMRRFVKAGLSMITCYALGALAHHMMEVALPMLTVLASAVCLQCRRCRVPPPGPIFFVLPACVAAYTPPAAAGAWCMLALFSAGVLWACLVAALYIALQSRKRVPTRESDAATLPLEPLLYDALVLGALVGVSLLLAQALGLARPYWAPVSCLVVQGGSLKITWERQLHRLLGTALGVWLAWGILQRSMTPWELFGVMTLLTILAETAIVRHYALAVVFITPLTIFLADAPHLNEASPAAMVWIRLWDTVLGCWVGLAGAGLLHNARCRDAVTRALAGLVQVVRSPTTLRDRP